MAIAPRHYPVWKIPTYGMSSLEYSDIDPNYGELWSAADAVQEEQKVEALKRYDGLKLVKTLVDVGGNKGRALATIVATHPHIRGINFDLPHVVAEAPDIPGVEHVAGNLLDSDIPCADTMLLSNVVHMFNDEDALEALQNCKKSLTPDGKLLIYDPILPSEFGGEPLHGGGTDDGHSTAGVYRRGGSH